MNKATLVNANDLARWAGTRTAQADLPRLLRRLVLASCPNATSVSFRAGEGIGMPGWDGRVDTPIGTPFVPEGFSVWEAGADQSVGSKADSDYNKRTDDPLDVDPISSIFVFVTPRRWPGKDKWIEEKQAEGRWREVRAYDADDLETWLENAPAVHLWLSVRLGKHPDEALDIECYWEDFAKATNPEVTPALVTGGRVTSQDDLNKWFAGSARTISVQAETREEAVAFIGADLLSQANGDAEAWRARCVVVHTATALRSLSCAEQPLFLVPLCEDAAAVSRASSNGHRVLLPLGRADTERIGDRIDLDRPHRADLEAALKEMGFTEDQASDLSVLARRSLTAYRRRTAVSAALLSPEWSKPEYGRHLVPILLAGQWNDACEADREAMEVLSGGPYTEVRDVLVRWMNEPDAPVRQIATTWTITSREDAWPLLAKYVTADDLVRLRDTCLRVLCEEDPSQELPLDQRFAASFLKKDRKHSAILRHGLAETLASMAALPAPVAAPGGSDWQRWADMAVRAVFETSSEAALWMALWPNLPLLAEASPDQFLAATERLCDGDLPIARDMFEDQEHGMMGTSAHTGLLWALEQLAWSPLYLSHAVRLLARLALIDPGGKTANRPAESIGNILCAWCPITSASVEQKLAALDLVQKHTPDVAWPILRRLVPRAHEIGYYTSKPRWRDWAAEGRPTVTRSGLVALVGEVVTRLLHDVGLSGARWKDIVEAAPEMPPADSKRVVARLAEIDPKAMEMGDRVLVWNALRETLARHLPYPEAPWALPKDITDQIMQLYKQFTPAEDVVALNAWLFCWHPDPLPPIEDWQERHHEVTRLQEIAAADVYCAGGLDAICRLARQVDSPHPLGYALGHSAAVSADEETAVLDLVDAGERAEQSVAYGFIQGRVCRSGIEWYHTHRTGGWFSGATPSRRASFLRCLPTNNETLDIVDAADEETRQLFWKSIPPFPGDVTDHSRVVERLVGHGRVASAIEYIQAARRDGELPLPAKDVAEVMGLFATVTEMENVDWSMFSYAVGELLDGLAASDDVEDTIVGRLEWLFLPMFRYDRRPPQVVNAG